MRTLAKWSVADYQHMRDLGILDHRRCELINGDIWDITLERELHRFIRDRSASYLRQVLQDIVEVFEGHPITLAESEPQPDIASEGTVYPVAFPDVAIAIHKLVSIPE